MKLSLAAFFLGNFILTLKCPYTGASEIRTRRPKKIRDTEPLPGTEISLKCVKIKKRCNNIKKKCCDGLTCVEKKCADLRTFELRQELLLQYSKKDINAVSTSHNSNTILVQGKDKTVTHVLSGLFESPMEVPGYSQMLTHDSLSFSPFWTNCVSGDGRTIAISDYEKRIVKVYRLRKSSDINESGWKLLGQEIVGEENLKEKFSNFGSSLALSLKGDILVVGADYGGFNRTGALERFELREDSWVSVGTGIDGQFPNDQIGRYPLEISKDSSRILVGGGRNGFASAYDWDKEEKDWSLVKRFTFDCIGWLDCVCNRSCTEDDPQDDSTDPQYGQEKVFLSNDGNIVAIGEHDYDPNREEGSEGAFHGAIHFFEWKTNKFVEFARTLVGQKGAEFGWAFGMSDDGTRLVTGNYKKDEVYHYKKVGKRFVRFETITTGGFYDMYLSRDGTKLTVTSTVFDHQVNTYTLK